MNGGSSHNVSGLFSWVVFVVNANRKCIGSAVNNRWVLTATQCFGDSKSVIQTGDIKVRDQQGRDYTVDYVKASCEINLTLLHTGQDLQPAEFAPCCLATTRQDCKLVGDQGGQMHYVGAEVMRRSDCQRKVNDHRLGCVVPRAGRGPCAEDLGAPLVCDERLEGVVSWQMGGCDPGSIVYEDMPYARSLLDEVQVVPRMVPETTTLSEDLERFLEEGGVVGRQTRRPFGSRFKPNLDRPGGGEKAGRVASPAPALLGAVPQVFTFLALLFV